MAQWSTAVNGGNPVTITNGGAAGTNTYQFSSGGYNGISFTPATGAQSIIGAGSASTGNKGFDAMINSLSYATRGIQLGAPG